MIGCCFSGRMPIVWICTFALKMARRFILFERNGVPKEVGASAVANVGEPKIKVEGTSTARLGIAHSGHRHLLILQERSA